MSEANCEACRLVGLCDECKQLKAEAVDLTQVFLNELTSMSLRYGLIISGCGCCGSPSIDTEKGRGHYVYTDRLEWKKSDPPTPMVDHPVRHQYCGTEQVCAKCSQPFDNHQ